MGKSKTIGKPDYFNFGKYAVGGIGFSMTNQFILVYLTFFCTGGRSHACYKDH